MAEGWEHVPDAGLVRFLEAKGLGGQATRLLEVMEADSVEDLKLVDAALAEEIVAAAGLKLVSAKKFRLAVAELRGEAPASGAATGAVGEPEAEELSRCPGVGPGLEGLAGPGAEPLDPEEVVVLCIDRSGSMQSPFLGPPRGPTLGTTRNRCAVRAWRR